MTLAQFLESTREMTESDRHAAMTREELDAEDVKKQIAKEQKSAPKMLAGLVALQVQVHRSFEDAVSRLLAEERKAVLAKLTGSKGEELIGEILDDVGGPPDLRGKLPGDEPCYAILLPSETQFFLISWLPDGAGAKQKMKCSTFKASVLDTVKGLMGARTVVHKEISDPDDLDNCFVQASSAEAADETDAKPASDGPRRPPGGFALPGIGPGGIALPGMGGFPKKS